MSSQHSTAATSSVSSSSENNGMAMVGESGRILSAKYLQNATNKRDLIVRLRKVLQLLREDEDVEVGNRAYPGLNSLCHALTKFVNHRDKEIRLYTASSCMELFTIYAPEAPWTTNETLEIFRQTIRQIGNLAHTTSTKQPHFYDYYRMLELMAEVKIPVLLVDLYKVNDDHHKKRMARNKKKDQAKKENHRSRNRPGRKTAALDDAADSDLTEPEDVGEQDDDDDDSVNDGTSQEALQILTDLFRTLLDSVRVEHPREILDFCEKTMTSSIEEFFESTLLPVPILDQILLSIGQGRNVLVLQQQQQQQQESVQSKATVRSSKRRLAEPLTVGVPQYIQQMNPSYIVASAVLRHNMERLSSPIATLLNGLVNSDSRSIGESSLSSQLEEKRDKGHWNNPDENAEKSNTIVKKGKQKKEPEMTLAEKSILEMAENIGKPQPQQQDSHVTSNVWNIIYELQFVAPSILTTIVGNLASHIGTADFGQRVMVTQTLGKIFATGKKNELNLTRALEYSPCFRQWLERSEDRRLEIRRLMLPHLLALAKACPPSASPTPTAEKVELIRDVQNTLLRRLIKDPSVPFRLEVIQGLCNIAYQHRRILSKDLMDRIGMQVLSKNKEERKNALTGLVQMYFRQYLKFHLQPVSEGGDDCPLNFVLDVLAQCCRRPPAGGESSEIENRLSLLSPKGNGRRRPGRRTSRADDSDSEQEEDEGDGEVQETENHDDFEYYQWIPPLLFQSFSYTDSFDSEMRSRVFMLVDDLLLGSELPLPDNKRRLTSTARATGLAVIVDVVRNRAPLAWRWLRELLDTRAKLQTTLKSYIDARADIRNHVTGSEEFLAAESKAMNLLESVASMTPAPSGATPTPGDQHPVLEKFHSIKDRHVFRILATITHPNHSVNARVRAMDDAPKRVKAAGAGEAATSWVRSLVRRCAMGDFLNQDIVHHCILLAHECFHHEEYVASQRFLTCVQMAAIGFPQLCASEEDFVTLTELFRDCSGVSPTSSKNKIIRDCGLITTLSAVLAAASPHRAIGEKPTKCEEDIHTQLIHLCREGTPEQARHATATVVALLKPKEGPVLTQEQNHAFFPLLHTLVTPSQLSIASTSKSTKLASVLVALAELADHAPKLFETEKQGQAALKFALNIVLLGRKAAKSTADWNGDEFRNSNEEDGDDLNTPTRRRRSKAKKTNEIEEHLSPTNQCKCLVDDDNLSITCRTLCAAIEFICTFIRSSVLTDKVSKQAMSLDIQQLIENFINALSIVVRDEGMPPSSRDRKFFGLRQDRAALRQCAAINILRLCDTRLGLDQKHLSTQRWHLLAGMFLDEERVVRSAMMEELGEMLTANGKYAASFGQGAMAPRLRFLAFAVLCTDGDHNANHSPANGGAANVGKHIHNVLGNAHGCVSHLRRVYEAGAAQARANGEEAEKRYQTFTKVTVMPEYSVPFAFHLLAFRRETPPAESGRKKGTDEDYVGEISMRSDDKAVATLTKRIRNLFEILTATADGNNVSFLLRMTEIISAKNPKLGIRETEDGEVSQRKLLKVCQVSREVLLSLVKRDDNLTAFPGQIFIPVNLFSQSRPKRQAPAHVAGPSLGDVRSLDNTDGKEVVSPPERTYDETVDALEVKGTDEPSRFSRDSSESRESLLSSQETKLESDISPLPTRMKRKSAESAATVSSRPVHIKRSRESSDDRFVIERTPNKSVHFSPDRPVEFGELSPIVKNPSPNDALVSSGETKTRGTTPPTQLALLSAATVKSPTPVSSDSISKELDGEPDSQTPKPISKRRTRRIRPSNEKENVSAAKKRRKSNNERPHDIKTIKIVRKHSPNMKTSKNDKTKAIRQGVKRKTAKGVDPLDFDG
ncbi:hypothetical protein IV203_026140 [Nitzschia inconspicua]|uniref:Sister chromatid cohesion protein n=1 Tax=Nitzschia inconspicua TaxID=303405 RepID=A0A9K3LI28_9STRA|nr:hypothetical protein IV203_026140 [Nitzschia inconspicua]